MIQDYSQTFDEYLNNRESLLVNRFDIFQAINDLFGGVSAENISDGVFGATNDTTGIEFGVNRATLKSYVQSRNFVSGSTGWQILADGTAEFKSITLTGGTFKYGKTSFTDSTNAGYYLGSEGIYLGSASDANYIKYTISSGAFAVNGAITTNIGSSINGTYLTSLSVATGALANLAVTAAKIDNATITATQIANATITTTQISGTAGITGGQIASATITSDNIVNATIVGGDIATGTITATNITNATITTTQISGTAGITGSQIANATITGTNIGSATITATNIANATITTTQISGTAGITGGQIANATITATQITNATITTTQIANATIIATNISATAAITGSQLSATAGITGTQIANTTITGSNISNNTITIGKTSIPTHFISGTFTDNSPAAGSVAWSGVTVDYNGTTYSITNGNTASKYIWWDYSLSTTTFQTAAALPTLANEDCLVATNTSGTHRLVWRAYDVNGDQIQLAAITGSLIANTTITGGNLVSNTITATQIANATITGTQIASTTIAGSNLINNTISATQIANATITTTQISATAGITGGQIANATITATNITAGTITATEIANLTITAAKIANATITTTQISGTAAITGTQIAAATITGSNIAATTITATNITALTITAAEIAEATITTGKIVSLNIDKLNAGTITSKAITLAVVDGTGDVVIKAGKTDFGDDATSGFILGVDDSVVGNPAKFEIGSSATKVMKYDGTDWSLTGGTITGGTIQTATAGKRVVISGNVLEFYNATPTNVASLNAGALGASTFLQITVPVGAGFYPIDIVQNVAAYDAIAIDLKAASNGLFIYNESTLYGIHLKGKAGVTSPLLYLEQAGTGTALKIAQTNSGDAIAITNTVDCTELINLNPQASGTALYVNMSFATSASPGIEINQDGTGRGAYIHCDKTTSTNQALLINHSGLGYLLALSPVSNASRTKASLLLEAISGQGAHLELSPIANTPQTPSEGEVYADTDHHLYYYNGTVQIPLTTNLFAFTAGDYLLQSADTERQHSVASAWQIQKEIQTKRGGIIRIKFDLKSNDAGSTAYGKIYKNGVAVGTEWTQGETYATKSEDIANWATGDLIQLYTYNPTTAANAFCRNFRIYVGSLESAVVNTD